MEHLGESGEISNVGSEEGSTSPKDRQRKLSDLSSVVTEIMSRLREDPETMEAEVERILGGYIDRKLTLEKHRAPCIKKRDSMSEVYPNTTRHLILKFRDKLSPSVVTGEYIKGEEGNSIRVALVDSLTGQLVDSSPVASAKVEIVVLEKDSNGGSEWKTVEFDSANVGRREGNKALLSGNVYCTLANGVGVLDLVKFKHTKRWMKKQEYRLGARILDDFPGFQVEEAMTEPFVVEDKRGKLYQKSYPPSLSHEVWRVEGIGKEGSYHKRLRDENFHTVKDLLILLNTNPERLAQILRVSTASKIWEVIVHHARTCLPDEGIYLFYPPVSQQSIAVLFDVVGQLKGLLMEHQFVPSDELSTSQKADAHQWVVSAFQHWGDVVHADDVASLSADYQQLHNSVHVANYNSSDHQDGSDFEVSNIMCPDGYTQLDTTRNLDGTISHRDASIAGDFDQLGTGNLNCISSQDFCLQDSTVYSGVEEAGLVTLDTNYAAPSFFGRNEEENGHFNLYGSYSPFQDDMEWELENFGASSHNIMQSPDLSWDQQFSSIDNFQHNNSLTYDQLTFPMFPVSSSASETEFVDDGFFVDELLKESGCGSSPLPGHAVLELQEDPHPGASTAVAKVRKRNFNRKNAQRRWKILFSIMRWFSVRRDVKGRTPAYKDQNALSRFGDHKSKNTTLGLQASLHSSVNDIFMARSAAVAMNKVQRKYMSKRDKAQARWRMLFSVMRWFSVKRNVDIKIRVRDMLRNFSVSSQGDDVPSHYSTGDTDRRCEHNLSFHHGDHVKFSAASVCLNKSNRRYLARRNKAQRRWRMVFSIVRWFSVRRNVNEKGRLMLMGCT